MAAHVCRQLTVAAYVCLGIYLSMKIKHVLALSKIKSHYGIMISQIHLSFVINRLDDFTCIFLVLSFPFPSLYVYFLSQTY